MMKIILASNSPRRRALFGLFDLDFEVMPADVDETPFWGEAPADYVRRMAASKGRHVAGLSGPDHLVISADTTVVDRDQILGKPADAAEAEKMLRQLRGRQHQVYTAIALIQGGKMVSDCCRSDVPMRVYSDEEMQAYIASGDPLDKAGAYAIQNAEFRPVEAFSGCFANVMGLPLCHLNRLMAPFNLHVDEPVFQFCEIALDYHCEIYPQILD